MFCQKKNAKMCYKLEKLGTRLVLGALLIGEYVGLPNYKLPPLDLPLQEEYHRQGNPETKPSFAYVVVLGGGVLGGSSGCKYLVYSSIIPLSTFLTPIYKPFI